MPEWLFDWSGWAFGLFGVLVVIFGWTKIKRKQPTLSLRAMATSSLVATVIR